jgi:peptidoglycan/xylan/chitin deacetylase (PgdA/CDA1 family)
VHNRRASWLKYCTISYFLLIIASLSGCAGEQVIPPQPLVPPVEATPTQVAPPAQALLPPGESPKYTSFVAVTVKEGDTLSSLASQYLNDASKGWMIAEFNEVSVITPGEKLIIPLKYFERGGLTVKGHQTVPVLTYHKFSESKTDKMTVTASNFEEQMKFLKDNGYHVITLNQLFDFLDFKIQIPKKSVVIAIDDGWRSTYDIAFPILKKYGYPATLFVYTALITGSKVTLNWDLINEMAGQGVDLQCHTRTHRKLTAPASNESFKEYFEAIEKELFDAAKTIKMRTNREVQYLSYPFGDINHLGVAMLKKQGYRGGVTATRAGNAFFVNNYRVNRSMIFGEYNLQQFEKNLVTFTEEPLK